jgi:hypothetical protein
MDQFVTPWLHCSQENKMLFEKGVLHYHLVSKMNACTPTILTDDLCKLRSESATLFPGLPLIYALCSFASYGFRVRDEEEILPDPVLCVGYHVGYSFCGICERFRLVL